MRADYSRSKRMLNDVSLTLKELSLKAKAIHNNAMELKEYCEKLKEERSC